MGCSSRTFLPGRLGLNLAAGELELNVRHDFDATVRNRRHNSSETEGPAIPGSGKASQR
jgi:hypothetical protein